LLSSSTTGVTSSPFLEQWWTIDRSLVPANKVQHWADLVMAGLRKSSGSANFTALHLRIEDDWIEHCKTWKGGDNCYTNTDVLDNVLEIEGVPTSQPLYLAAGIPWELLKVWLRAPRASSLPHSRAQGWQVLEC
jgi:hypothetical protein